MGKISLIVAHDRARGIGKDNKLPWKLPNDMKHFKDLTYGHTVVMGRKTYESIGRIEGLVGRRNIVLSKTIPKFNIGDQIYVFREFEVVLAALKKMKGDFFIIGGAEIYKLFFPHADQVFVTEVDGIYGCDAFFPKLSHTRWKLVELREGSHDVRNIPHTFLKFERRND